MSARGSASAARLVACLACAIRVRAETWPVIGVLTVPTFRQWDGERTATGAALGPMAERYDCFVPAGYTKLVESGMARVSLLPCAGPWADFRAAVSSVNGYLFTGMFTDYQDDLGALTEYGRRGEYIIRHVIEQNRLGVWLPLLAFCKGFNMLAFVVSGVAHWRELIRADFAAMDWPAPVQLNPAANHTASKLLRAADSAGAVPALTGGSNLMNRHPYGITPAAFRGNAALAREFGPVVATALDARGQEFVAMIEHTNFPIYGVASHPEKVLFEWRVTLSTPHTADSRRANAWFAGLLGDDARRNNRTFTSPALEADALLYGNAVADMRGLVNGEFRQAYFSGSLPFMLR